MDKMKMQTPDITESNIEKIGQLFPNCLTERIGEGGKVEQVIDFDQLRQELSKEIVEGPQERYQFTWPDKKKAIRLANTPSTMTLRPCREESVDFDNTENLYIEGDNLEVLKLLRENYLGKVKMIYIDPPYNTGNDFVYEDDFSQTAADYAGNSGQSDELGNRLVQNTESNGRFHTDWLNMLYPRLKVARDLLAEDGVIYISIDDNEVYNLKKICDEVFGSSNFIANIIWEKADSPRNDAKTFSVRHDYILLYAKSYHDGIMLKKKLNAVAEHYDKIDESGNKYYLKPLRYMGTADTREARPSLYFPITAPDRELIYPQKADGSDGRWRWSKEKVAAESDRLEFIKGKNGWSVNIKIYADLETGVPFETIWYNSEVGSNRTAIAEIRTLFGEEKPFSTPKPINLIKNMIDTVDSKEITILDFFSGSATTAHAAMLANFEYHRNIKFIMVQLPEETDPKSEAYKAGYKNICEIGKERIRRAGKKILEEQSNANAEEGLFAQTESKPKVDIGFRVLKLDSSNMNDVYYRPEEFSEQLIVEDNVKEDRTPEDLLFQVMLECNLPLSAKIKTEKISGKEVFTVGNGYLLACFDENVNEDVITAVAKRKPYYFVMRDSSLSSDNVADNFEQIFQAYSKDTIRRIL